MMRVACSVLVVSLGLVATGCPRPIGACQYGDAGGEHWMGTIVEIEAVEDGSGEGYVIHVDGEKPQEVRLSEDGYNDCVAAKKLKVGSSVEMAIEHGGPCPPRRQFQGCVY